MNDPALIIGNARAMAQLSRERILPALGNPAHFTLNDVDYAAAIRLTGVRPDLTADGQRSEQTVRITVRKSLLSAPPEFNTPVTVAGFEFLIDPNQEQKDTGDTWIIRAKRQV